MQNPNAKVYKGIVDCLRQIIRKDGVGSLYKVLGIFQKICMAQR